MGNKTRDGKEGRTGPHRSGGEKGSEAGENDSSAIARLEDELRRVTDGEAVFWISDDCPEEVKRSYLEDVIAFESVESGTSLFEGLEENGLKLPPPDRLDERQSAEKVMEIFEALAGLRIFLVGFEEMTAGELYRRLWHETLWEACYVKKRDPRALTIIDVSRTISRADLLDWIGQLRKSSAVQ